MKSGMVDMESNTTLVQNYPAHEAVPQGEGPFPAVVVAHDEFGLNIFVRGVANRLAQAGFYTLTPALYAFPSSFVELAPALMRSPAPIEFGYDEAFIAGARATSLTDERALDLLAKAIRYAQTRSVTRSGPVGLLGFSIGARLVFRAACESQGDVAACVCFYPGGLFSDRLGKDHELAMAGAINLQAPVLFFYGALDREVSPSERASLRQVLSALGKDVTLEEYGGAGHDFLCSDRETFHVGAAKKSWDETLTFFRSRLG
jgi:carboxymethylenebutenolidase